MTAHNEAPPDETPRPLSRRRPLSPRARRAAARMVIAANEGNGEIPDPRIVAIANRLPPRTALRPLAPEVRRAAARLVIAANEANDRIPDPRIVDIANGKDC